MCDGGFYTEEYVLASQWFSFKIGLRVGHGSLLEVKTTFLDPTWKRLVRKKSLFFFLPTVNAYLLLTSLKVCDWSGHIFGASASPRSLTKKWLPGMSPSSTVHGGQHDTKYVTFELLMHAAFVADGIWAFMLEPARML